MDIKSGINWTRSAIALALLCAVFCFGVSAQNNPNKPLDAEAASALVQEVTDGLPDLIEDEAQVTAITEKWGERRDLVGKTREQILKVLQADVESVVNDPKILDSIWKAWTTEKETDEEEQLKTPQEPTTPAMKVPETPAVVVAAKPSPAVTANPQPVTPVTREFNEPTIEVQRLGSYIDGPWTVIGAYYATSYQPTPVCVRPPGSRFTNKACVEAQELKIPAGSPPEYLCETKEGKGNCRQHEGLWIPKACKYGYRYFLWRRTMSGAGPTSEMGNSLICTSGTTPVPGEPLP